MTEIRHFKAARKIIFIVALFFCRTHLQARLRLSVDYRSHKKGGERQLLYPDSFRNYFSDILHFDR